MTFCPKSGRFFGRESRAETRSMQDERSFEVRFTMNNDETEFVELSDTDLEIELSDARDQHESVLKRAKKIEEHIARIEAEKLARAKKKNEAE